MQSDDVPGRRPLDGDNRRPAAEAAASRGWCAQGGFGAERRTQTVAPGGVAAEPSDVVLRGGSVWAISVGVAVLERAVSLSAGVPPPARPGGGSRRTPGPPSSFRLWARHQVEAELRCQLVQELKVLGVGLRRGGCFRP